MIQQQISEIAGDLFLTKGYEQTTFDDIAEKVGLSRRTIFRYFPTKEAIVIAKFGFATQKVFDVFFENYDAHHDIHGALRESLQLFVPESDAVSTIAQFEKLIFETESLMGLYLVKVHELEERIIDHLTPPNNIKLQLTIYAGFNALILAQHAWQKDSSLNFETLLFDRLTIVAKQFT